MQSPDMRIASPLICLGLLTQCQPVALPPIPHHVAAIPAPATASTPPPVAAPQYLRKSIAGITFQGISFDARTHRLRVVFLAAHFEPGRPAAPFPPRGGTRMRRGGRASARAQVKVGSSA